ncbi:MAG: reverse transcriptase domain-containing protein [Acidimicrobiales bacterium]
MNIGDPWPGLDEAEVRVLGMQTKLHQWATDDPKRRFDDLYNLVYDPAFLVVAWHRVRGNKGARSAGVDGVAPRSVVFGASELLAGLRDDLKARTFTPLPVRERMIPKTDGKLRRLGIPTARDRVVQAALKLVLEPIFEADFRPCSHGFRPGRRAQDAIAEIRHLTSVRYEWVLEGDITACFDEIDHTALLDRVRDRIGDKRVVGLVKAFLKAGVLSEDGINRDTDTGTPQGGILSPLLANIALSVLDDHFAETWQNEMATTWQRKKRRNHGHPNYRLIRYADDFVRHEAPHDRVEMKGLHLWPVAAGRRSWGQSEPGDAGEGGKQPRQRRDGLVLPDDLGPASKTGRCNESESVAKPLNRRAGSNLVDMGRSAVHDHHGVVVDSDAGRSPRSGGHTESLRRRCGEAAGAQLDASPVDRRVVNVGTIPASPFPPPRQGGDGQVRRRLLMLGWDGALVVVRAPESGAHGEGGQRVRRLRCGMPGGRR